MKTNVTLPIHLWVRIQLVPFMIVSAITPGVMRTYCAFDDRTVGGKDVQDPSTSLAVVWSSLAVVSMLMDVMHLINDWFMVLPSPSDRKC